MPMSIGAYDAPGAYDTIGAYDSDVIPVRSPAVDREKERYLVSVLRNLFQIARDHKRSRYDTWIRNYRLVNNRVGSQSSANWMPAPRDSEIYPTLSSLVAWMTDQQITMDFVPAVDPSMDSFDYALNLADDLSQILFTTWMVEDYEHDIKLGLWDAFQYGVGIYKNVWDNSLEDGYGNAVLRRVDPWAFYVDPHATSTRDMEYCCEARRMSLAEIERRFPDARKLLNSVESSGDLQQIDEAPTLYGDSGRSATGPGMNPGSLPSSGTWPGSGSGVSRLAMPGRQNRQYDPLPGYVVYEFWLRENRQWQDTPVSENEKDMPQVDTHVQDEWRVIVMCNGRILLDEMAEDLWSHKSHPYERYVFDDIGEFYGISLVDHLAYPQIYINRLLTALQHNAELTGNPVLLEAQNSGTTRVNIVSRPGARIPVSGPAGMANAPKWLDPPQMPSQVVELVQFWISRIENTSGLSAMQKGAMPNQRSAEGVMENISEAAFVRIRSGLGNLEGTLRRCTIKLADLIVDNYNEPRMMALLGQDGQSTAVSIKNRHFEVRGEDGWAPMKFILKVEAGSTQPTSRSGRTSEAKVLRALNCVDDLYVLQAHGIRNPQRILDRLYKKESVGVGAPPARQRSGRTT